MNEVKIREFLFPCLEKLKIKLSEEQYGQLDSLASAMLSDPMYKSVSKIFDPHEMAMKHFLDSLAPVCFNLPLWKSAKLLILVLAAGFHHCHWRWLCRRAELLQLIPGRSLSSLWQEWLLLLAY